VVQGGGATRKWWIAPEAVPAEAWAAQDGAVDIAVLYDTAIAAVRGNA
jgi:hypothetical protein